MTIHLVEESAATRLEETKPPIDAPAASTAPDGREGTRAGLWLASVVLSGVLGAWPGAGGVGLESAFTTRRRDDYACESGTTDDRADVALVAEAKELFEHGASEFFEDGMRSPFSVALLRFVAEHGRSAFRAIAEYLYSGEARPDVASEALRWLADAGDASTLNDRWAVLQTMLRDRSPRVRDGAILGFAAIDDPRAKPVLLQARQFERIAELRRLIEQVIAQLDETANAATADRSTREPLA